MGLETEMRSRMDKDPSRLPLASNPWNKVDPPYRPVRHWSVWHEIRNRIRIPLVHCHDALAQLLPGHEGWIDVWESEGSPLQVGMDFGGLDPEQGTLVEVELEYSVVEAKPDGIGTAEELEALARARRVLSYPQG